MMNLKEIQMMSEGAFSFPQANGKERIFSVDNKIAAFAWMTGSDSITQL
jgi:hypothetical protein